MERVALLTERMVGLSAEHITKQQVLSSAMATGAISTATMAAAQEKLALSLAKSAAAQGALSTAQAAAQKVVSLQQELAIAQSNFVSSGGGPGQMVLWQQMQATETELNRATLATAGLTDAEVDLAAANREVASTQKLITEAMAASTFAMAGTVAIIAAVIAVLVALVIAIYSAKKAWDEFWIAVKVGAAEQTDMFGLKAMIGESQKAKQALADLREFQAGSVFSFKDVTGSAQQLTVMETPIANLTKTIKAFGDIAAATTGETITSITNVYNRVVTAMEGTTGVGSRQLQQFTSEGMNLSKMLADSMGVDQTKIQDMFAHRKITMDDINKSILVATSVGGIYYQKEIERAGTYNGALEVLGNHWDSIKAKFGEPIASALAGVLVDANGGMTQFEASAARAGENIAHIIRALTLIGQEQGWQTALTIAWTLTVDAMALILVTTLVGIMTKLGPAMADAMWQGWTARIKQDFSGHFSILPMDMKVYGQTLMDDMIGGMASKDSVLAAALHKILSDAMASTEKTITASAGLGAAGAAAGVTGGIGVPGKTPYVPDLDKYKTDLKEINDYWYQMTIIQAEVTDETEKQRRIFEATQAMANKLYNPDQLLVYLEDLKKEGLLQGDLMVQEASRLAKEKEMDVAIKNGTASTMDSITRGIEKAKEAFGNMDQMIEKMSTQIVNVLDNDISNGLVDIMNGTKSVAQGFHDMALSIVSDIEKIIIKMLVEYALQQAMNAMGMGGAVQTWQQNAASGSGVGQGAHGATGGTVFGGSGTRDDVPAMLTGGEYVFSKDAVSNAGGASAMDRWHEAAKAGQVRGFDAGGLVTPGRMFYGNPSFPGMPTSLYSQAAVIALRGNMPALQSFMSSQGFPMDGAWCGEFASAVVTSMGGTPPNNPQVASNWRTWGTPDPTPQIGDIAVRNGAQTGDTGSHVTFVGDVNPDTGMFQRIGGNQAGIDWRNSSGYTFYQSSDPYGGIGSSPGAEIGTQPVTPLSEQPAGDLYNPYTLDQGQSIGSTDLNASMADLGFGTRPAQPLDYSTWATTAGFYPGGETWPSPTPDSSVTQYSDPNSTDLNYPTPTDLNYASTDLNYQSTDLNYPTGAPSFDNVSNTTPGGSDTVSQNVGGTDIHDFGSDTSLGANLTDSQYIALQTPVNTTTPSDFNQAQWDSGMWGYNSAGEWTNWQSPDLQNAASSQPWQQNVGQTWQQNATGGNPLGLPPGAFAPPSDPYGDLSSLGYSPGPNVDFGTAHFDGGALYAGMISGKGLAALHDGGYIPSFASGGVMKNTGLAQLHAGEGVFRPDQMAQMAPVAPAAPNITSHVEVAVHFHSDGTTSSRLERSSASDKQARDLAKTVEAITVASMRKQVRVGGVAYRPRN